MTSMMHKIKWVPVLIFVSEFCFILIFLLSVPQKTWIWGKWCWWLMALHVFSRRKSKDKKVFLLYKFCGKNYKPLQKGCAKCSAANVFCCLFGECPSSTGVSLMLFWPWRNSVTLFLHDSDTYSRLCFIFNVHFYSNINAFISLLNL